MGKKITFLTITIFIVTFFFSVMAFGHYSQFDNRVALRQLVDESGIWGPFLIILLQAIQVIFIPIPGQLTGIISGYFFGAILGTVYSIIGLTIGSFVAFYLSRKFGTPFVEKFVPKKISTKFSFVTEDIKLFAIFLVFLLPFFPDDAVCFLCGLTNIKIKTLVIIAFLGRLPGCAITNMFGSEMASSKIQYSLYLGALILMIIFLVYRNRKKLELYVKKIA